MFTSKIQEISTKRNVILGLVLSIVCLFGIVAIAVTLNGIILDIRFAYSFEQVTDLFDVLGAEGLQLYSFIHVIDVLYPLASGFTVILAITYLTKNRPEGSFRFLTIIPVLAIIFDLAENILIESQIAAYPVLSELIVSIASLFTGIKWICIMSGLLIIIILVILNSRKKE
ncbi:MAG: hypothetical protein ACW99U_00115 [Candidatus Thorarchaeota archaeon]|jgi:hypothetical protein